jgi:hypothetical protein
MHRPRTLKPWPAVCSMSSCEEAATPTRLETGRVRAAQAVGALYKRDKCSAGQPEGTPPTQLQYWERDSCATSKAHVSNIASERSPAQPLHKFTSLRSSLRSSRPATARSPPALPCASAINEGRCGSSCSSALRMTRGVLPAGVSQGWGGRRGHRCVLMISGEVSSPGWCSACMGAGRIQISHEGPRCNRVADDHSVVSAVPAAPRPS